MFKSWEDVKCFSKLAVLTYILTSNVWISPHLQFLIFPIIIILIQVTIKWCFIVVLTCITWCWRRLLRVPWMARRSNQSILREISPGISLEGVMLKLKLQYLATSCEELTHWKRLWCWEGLAAGGEGDDRGWDGWMASLTRWLWIWVNSRSWWWTGRPGVLRFMGLQRDRHDWATELNWTESLND